MSRYDLFTVHLTDRRASFSWESNVLIFAEIVCLGHLHVHCELFQSVKPHRLVVHWLLSVCLKVDYFASRKFTIGSKTIDMNHATFKYISISSSSFKVEQFYFIFKTANISFLQMLIQNFNRKVLPSDLFRNVTIQEWNFFPSSPAPLWLFYDRQNMPISFTTLEEVPMAAILTVVVSPDPGQLPEVGVSDG